MTAMDRQTFKDKHLIFVVTHHYPAAVALALDNLMKIVAPRPEVVVVIIDSASGPAIRTYLKGLKHERVMTVFLAENVGKAAAVNRFIKENISENNLPKTVWSFDPDIIFDPTSFDFLLEAVQNIERIGMLSMRYVKNCCNPELYLFLPPKNIAGRNGKTYNLVFPVLTNVAGGFFALRGELLRDPLNFRLYPIKEEKSYCMDDAALYVELKKHGYRSGYLNGTLALHLRSGKLVAPELASAEAAAGAQ